MTAPLYPFDITGSASANLIVNETHDLTELVIGPTKINLRKYQILLPTYAPFYSNRFMLKHMNSSGTLIDLVKDTDYRLVLPYIEATKSIALDIFGGIELLIPITHGTLKIYYQTLGGDWLADITHIVSRINEKAHFSPNYTSWDILTDKTDMFPIVTNDYKDDFINGHDELLAAINAVSPEISKTHGNTLIDIQHFIDVDNPHELTKAQIGLPDMYDTPPISLVEARNISYVDKYITAIGLSQTLLGLGEQVTISGPTTLAINTVGTYSITNYLSFVKYDASSILGKATVIGDKIMYKAPSTTGPHGFTVNGVKVNVTIT